jgi:hypothetical protein
LTDMRPYRRVKAPVGSVSDASLTIAGSVTNPAPQQ